MILESGRAGVIPGDKPMCSELIVELYERHAEDYNALALAAAKTHYGRG